MAVIFTMFNNKKAFQKKLDELQRQEQALRRENAWARVEECLNTQYTLINKQLERLWKSKPEYAFCLLRRQERVIRRCLALNTTFGSTWVHNTKQVLHTNLLNQETMLLRMKRLKYRDLFIKILRKRQRICTMFNMQYELADIARKKAAAEDAAGIFWLLWK
jgi:hypothetical protein